MSCLLAVYALTPRKEIPWKPSYKFHDKLQISSFRLKPSRPEQFSTGPSHKVLLSTSRVRKKLPLFASIGALDSITT
ncbi:hypothetical protein EYC84_001057 [Monilinia fructicola]|uniref:Uncharacterized protein n=1 Tax=Monilinia fructicola TaxID=38448 RepID=A0A5M9JN61_MONFR|nr:hypothetical protein EYC84_001057 [Monilinia fructicola]